MAVLPISGITYTPTFAWKSDKKTKKNEQTSVPSGMPAYKKIPVVMLMAMTPGLLTSAGNFDEPNQELETADAPRSIVPYNWAALRRQNIVYSTRNEHYSMVCVNDDHKGFRGKDISRIYVIPTGSGSEDPLDPPPEVSEIVYHNLDNDADFYTVMTNDYTKDYRTGKYASRTVAEVALTDADAKFILSLMSGDADWENNTDIRFVETERSYMHLPKFCPAGSSYGGEDEE